MRLFDHHVHSDGRSADDYELMALSGVATVLVPCSASLERRPVAASYGARFDRLIDEVGRAARYGVDLWVGLSVHPADMVDLPTALDGVTELEKRLSHPRVLAVGEVSLRKFTADEVSLLERQLAVAASYGKPVLVETPPELADFRRMRDLLAEVLDRTALDRQRVLLLDLDEEKLRLARSLCVGGYGIAVSPRLDGLFCIRDKLDHRRVLEVLGEWGSDRLMLNTGFHFGSADPLGLAKTVHRLRLAGVAEPTLCELAYGNAASFFGLGRD